MEAYPILSSEPTNQDIRANKNEVLDITLNSLPVPDDSTPWEQILEFRSDPDSLTKFTALRNWMSDVARMRIRPSEIQQKLESLISDYVAHMRLHKMKTVLETLRTIVIAEAGFLAGQSFAGLGRLPTVAGMIMTPVYSIRQRRIALLE